MGMMQPGEIAEVVRTIVGLVGIVVSSVIVLAVAFFWSERDRMSTTRRSR